MGESAFTHLHVHSEFSLLDGAASIKRLVARAGELGMSSLALTDHGNMFGAVEFYTAARKAGVKPILGMEAYIAPGSRFEKDAKGIGEASYHLLLLAENLQGYHNLLKLSSRAYLEGFYYRPRIDRELLEEFNEGLICTTACLGGEIPSMLSAGDMEGARAAAEWYLKVFGDERFFIEIQWHCEDQNVVTPMLVDLAQEVGAGLVATNDVHFLTADDHHVHEVLTCISTGKTIEDERRMRYPKELYLKSPAEMAAAFGSWPEALENTGRIAARCEVELDFSKQWAPVYRPPEGKKSEAYLRELCEAGIKKKYGKKTPEIAERLERELGVIQGKGFSSYFLIVWDFMNYARQRGIPCGTRGSGVGTLVGYVLGISNVDPLRYGLLFERFMDPERSEMPDIDVDICQNGRAEVIDYVRRKYGHVAQIITFGTMKARAVIRDVSRVLNVPLKDADALAKLVPEQLNITLADALEQEPKLVDWCERDPKIKEVIEVGQRLEGLARHASVHAAGVVVADVPLENLLPLYKQSDSEDVITQFDGPTVEKVGLLKMDFLGLRTLTTIERARELVRLGKRVEVDPDKIDLADQEVLRLFCEGRTKGMFQFESGGMRDLLGSMRPDRIEDLIAANALYRPGPMTLIPDYNARKHGQAWSLPHPIMEEVLAETYGIMVYQEQVMQMLNRLGGLPLARAYKLIKAISKKKNEIIQAERGQFIEGCVGNGLEKRQAEEIFALIEKFGGYGFNKSHSTQYAILAFQTAFFKTYFPTEFMAALLTFEMASTDKVAEYIDECRSMGIEVLPPDVNESFSDFTVIYNRQHESALAVAAEGEKGNGEAKKDARAGHEGKAKGKGKGKKTEAEGSVVLATEMELRAPEGGKVRGECIRFGLAAVKGVGVRAVENIIAAREAGGAFESLYDLCERIDTRLVNKGALEAMIKAGAMDGLGGTRAQLSAGLEDAITVANARQRDAAAGQMTLFGAFESDAEMKQESARLPEVAPWPQPLLLQYEKEVLGMYVTDHPLAQYAEQIHYYSNVNTGTLGQAGYEAEVTIGGIITRVRYCVTKNGKAAGARMAMFTMEDLHGTAEGVIFPDSLAEYEDLVQPDRMVFIRGRVDMRRDEPSIKAFAVYEMERAEEYLTKQVCVKLPGELLTEKRLGELQGLLHRHRGRCPVQVEVETAGGMRVVLGLDGGVRPGADFCRGLEGMVGRGNYRLLGV